MKWYHRFTVTENDCKTLTTKIDLVQKSVDNVNKSLLGLVIYLKSKDKTLDTSLFQCNSPIQLTPLGELLLTESGGKKFVNNNLKTLFEKLDASNLKSPLDVENASTAAILMSAEMDEFTSVKDFIYNNPLYRREGYEPVPIEISTLANIMGIYLRDKYLDAHPDFIHK